MTTRSTAILGDLPESSFGRVLRSEMEAALSAAGPAGANHLIGFIRKVFGWAKSHPEGRPWLEAEVDPFLGGIGAAEFEELGSSLSDPREVAALAALLAQNGPRVRLGPLCRVAVGSLGHGAPEFPPGADDTSWVKAARHVVLALGHLPRRREDHPVDLLVQAFNTWPGWLIEGLFQTIGLLPAFGFYQDVLATALLEAPSAAGPFAQAWGGGGAQRLSDLLVSAARGPKARPGDPRSVAPEADRAPGLATITEALGAVDGDLADLADALVRAESQHDEGLARLFSDYLDSRPENHAAVIDFCSFSGSLIGDGPLSRWGRGEVYSSTHSSMLSAAGRPRPPWLEEPDFPTNRVLASVSRESAIWLVRRQRTPRFVLDYLGMISIAGHHDVDAIFDEVLGSNWARARLRAAQGVEAASVMEKLDHLGRRNASAAALFDELFPALLPEIASRYLRPRFGWVNRFRDLMETDARSRIREAQTIDELDDVIGYSSNLGLLASEEIDEALGQRDAAEFTPSESDEDAFDEWFWRAGRSAAALDDLLDRVLDGLTDDRIVQLLDAPQFSRPDRPGPLDGQRLRNRDRIVRASGRRDPQFAETLIERKEGDALAEVLGNLADRGHGIEAWLETVQRLAPARWAHYAANMIAHAAIWETSRRGVTSLAEQLVSKGGASVPDDVWDDVWDALRRFIEAPEDPIAPDSLAMVGAVDLPGGTGCRARCQESVIGELERRRDAGEARPSRWSRDALVAALEPESEMRRRAQRT